MRYRLAPLFCRPWTLNGITPRLIESHYENNYGGALNRLNALTEEVEALDPATTPASVISRLKRDQNTALHSTLLHELYFASLGGDGRVVPEAMAAAITVEEVAAMREAGAPVQIIDALPRHSTTKSPDIMAGAVWRDTERIDEWIGELSKTEPVVTYCVYGFHIGWETAITLRKAGFDARYMAGGHYAWKAIKGPVKLLQ